MGCRSLVDRVLLYTILYNVYGSPLMCSPGQRSSLGIQKRLVFYFPTNTNTNTNTNANINTKANTNTNTNTKAKANTN